MGGGTEELFLWKKRFDAPIAIRYFDAGSELLAERDVLSI